MNCNLSGELCQTPVLSPAGHVFEKSLIEKHVKAHGTCPMTGNELKVEDLVPIKVFGGPVRPRPASATSLASLIKLFQNEWDAIMLETFNLKKALEQTRQELSNALYQEDAARRVIARLIKERDDARKSLADTQKNMSAVISETVEREKQEADADLENGHVKSDAMSVVVAKVSEFANALSKKRRKNRKKILSGVVSSETLSNYTTTSSVKIFPQEEVKSQNSSTCLEKLHSADLENTHRFLVGSASGAVRIVGGESLDALSFEHSLDFHKAAVTGLCSLGEDSFVSASEDSAIALWKNDEENTFTVANSFSPSTSAVRGIALQAMKQHCVAILGDSTWGFFDLALGRALYSSPAAQESSNADRCVAFHPDGLIFGAGGADRTLRIWDLNSRKNVASFEGHAGEVASLDFSENGYYLASGDAQGTVKLWDLRKSENIASLELGAALSAVRFDASGAFLGVAGEFGVSTYASKSWELVGALQEEQKASAVAFCGNAEALVAALPDSDQLRVFSAPE